MGLDVHLGHFADGNNLGLCLTNHVATTYVAEVTHICVTKCPRVLNFTLFHSTISCCRVTDHSETTAPNDPKSGV